MENVPSRKYILSCVDKRWLSQRYKRLYLPAPPASRMNQSVKERLNIVECIESEMRKALALEVVFQFASGYYVVGL